MMNLIRKNRILPVIIAVTLLASFSGTHRAAAEENNEALIYDDNVETVAYYPKDSSVTVWDDAGIKALYIKWDAGAMPGEWTLRAGDLSIPCGQNGYLHEYVELETPVRECTIELAKAAGICEVYMYPEDEIPEDIQRWETLPKDADMLVFVTHAGDEIIDFGALLAEYAAHRQLFVQVAYMCEYVTAEEKIKEHEMLDSLWKLGVKYYPVKGNFRNKRLIKLDQAKLFYGYDKVLEFVTENIRKYRPMVVIGPDPKGEYGNGAHMLLANAVTEAVNLTPDSAFLGESAGKYGTWNVPKTYLHKYDLGTGKTINIDLANGIWDIVKKAYDERITDTWCGTYISNARYTVDGDNYFGLYRSTVGADTMNYMFGNILTYGEQARIAAEEEAERQRIEEYERKLAAYNEQMLTAVKRGNVLYGRFLSNSYELQQ